MSKLLPSLRPPSPADFRLGYRGDIEGLRALAVLLVVITHAGLPGLSGGYIGVDVFFVISGYLITGLLVREIRDNGRIRLLAFYARRLRRLLPALLLMLFVSSIIAVFVYAPFEQYNQAKAALFSPLWASNIFFAVTDVGYFEQTNNTKLFLHTWSLGVEEQFYLAWPLLLMLFAALWKRQGPASTDSRLLFWMAILLAGSLSLSLWITRINPLWGFYMMPARAWQFALGACAVLWSLRGKPGSVDISHAPAALRAGKIDYFMGWTGLALILVAAFILDNSVTYPGLWAVLPSLGAVLILLAGDSQPRGVSRLLATTPMRWGGALSYSLYLWHWPVLLLADTLAKPNLAGKFGLIALALLLALISYTLVESPIRRGQRLRQRPLAFIAVALACMTVTAGGIYGWQEKAWVWLQGPDQTPYLTANRDRPLLYYRGCDQWYRNADLNVCRFGPPQAAKHTVVMTGDSIGLQWFPTVAPLFNKPGWQVLVVTKSACPMTDIEPFFYPRIGRKFTECNLWRDKVSDFIRELSPDLVFMGSSAAALGRDDWVEGSKRYLAKFAAAAGRVFIFSPTDGLPFHGPSCLARSRWQGQFFPSNFRCSAPAHNQRVDDIHGWLSQAAAGFDNISVIDMRDTVCPAGTCYAELSRSIVFRDDAHLTARFAASLQPAFLERTRPYSLEWELY